MYAKSFNLFQSIQCESQTFNIQTIEFSQLQMTKKTMQLTFK